MKIVVISDTHIKREEKWLPQEVEKVLQEADLMVHCGDFMETTELILWKK